MMNRDVCDSGEELKRRTQDKIPTCAIRPPPDGWEKEHSTSSLAARLREGRQEDGKSEQQIERPDANRGTQSEMTKQGNRKEGTKEQNGDTMRQRMANIDWPKERTGGN